MDPDVSIRELRERAGLSQRELASLSGVAQPNIAAYESGARRPSARMLERLTAAARPRPSTTLDRHRAEVRSLVAKYRGSDVRVFGSVVRDEDQPGSDIDLLVTFTPQASLYDQVALIEELEALLGVRVDVVSAAGLTSRHDDIRREAQPV